MRQECYNKYMNTEMREKLRVASLLAMNAGFMDAFSFFHFDGRFIGMQTGNMIQVAVYLAKGNFVRVADFIIPVLFFSCGVIFKNIYSYYLRKKNKPDTIYLLLLQWTGVTVFTLLYATVLKLPVSIFVGFLSFFMAIQHDTFSKTRGLPYGSIMMTGNLKSTMVNLTNYALTHEHRYLQNFRVFASLVGAFFLGTILGTYSADIFGNWTLLVSSTFLIIVYFMLRFEREEKI